MGKKRETHHPTDKYIHHTIQFVSPITGTHKVYVIWTNDEEAVIDISEIIYTNKHFKPLSSSAEFEKAESVAWGTGIEWDCGASIGSDHLRHMADQQGSVLHKKKRKSA